MRLAKASTEPPMLSATAVATSLADFTIRILIALSTVSTEPGLKPILLGGSLAAFFEIRTGDKSVISPALTARKAT